MCTNYTPTRSERLRALAGLPAIEPRASDWPPETWPGYPAPILARGPDPGAPARLGVARFGLVPRWARDRADATTRSRHTLNARSETVAERPSFRAPWRERHFALVPMDDFFEPCWQDPSRPGVAVRWRVAPRDGQPLTAAALWERWTDPATGAIEISFSLLTVNADGHAIMDRLHRPEEEKRMPVIVPPEHRLAWLQATPDQARALLRPYPAEALRSEAAPRPPARRRDTQTPEAG